MAKVNYDDQNSLVQALEGQEVLIITMGVMAPPDQQSKLIEAAAAANVKWVFPNEWGFNTENAGLIRDIPHTGGKEVVRSQIEKLGKSSWIGITCNFWYEFSLGGTSDRYGFDFANRTLTFFDDGTTRINTSTWPQCGRAIASLLSRKVLPEDENDKSPTLSHFRNKMVYISSFNVNQEEMFESVMRVTGTSTDDWKISYEDTPGRYQSATEALKKGDRSGFARMMYTRLFYQDGSGNYEASRGLDNDALGLPKEDLDEYTKAAIEYAEQGELYKVPDVNKSG